MATLLIHRKHCNTRRSCYICALPSELINLLHGWCCYLHGPPALFSNYYIPSSILAWKLQRFTVTNKHLIRWRGYVCECCATCCYDEKLHRCTQPGDILWHERDTPIPIQPVVSFVSRLVNDDDVHPVGQQTALCGMNIVITGTFVDLDKQQIRAYIQWHGGKTGCSCDYCNDNNRCTHALVGENMRRPLYQDSIIYIDLGILESIIRRS